MSKESDRSKIHQRETGKSTDDLRSSSPLAGRSTLTENLPGIDANRSCLNSLSDCRLHLASLERASDSAGAAAASASFRAALNHAERAVNGAPASKRAALRASINELQRKGAAMASTTPAYAHDRAATDRLHGERSQDNVASRLNINAAMGMMGVVEGQPWPANASKVTARSPIADDSNRAFQPDSGLVPPLPPDMITRLDGRNGAQQPPECAWPPKPNANMEMQLKPPGTVIGPVSTPGLRFDETTGIAESARALRRLSGTRLAAPTIADIPIIGDMLSLMDLPHTIESFLETERTNRYIEEERAKGNFITNESLAEERGKSAPRLPIEERRSSAENPAPDPVQSVQPPPSSEARGIDSDDPADLLKMEDPVAGSSIRR